MQAEGQGEDDPRRAAWHKYVHAWVRWAAFYSNMAVSPFFAHIAGTRAPSLASCMRMLTVLRLAVAYGFVDLQARPPQ